MAAAIEPPSAPLARAAFLGQPEAVAAALAAGSPVDERGDHDWTPLHWAAIGGQAETARVLLEHGANPDALGQFDLTPLHWAALGGHDRVIAALASRGASLDAQNLYGMTPLHLAGTKAVVLALSEAGATLDARDDRGLTPLFTVRTKEAGQALLSRGADVHARANDGRVLFDMLVVNTMERDGLILYGRRSSGRLREETSQVSIQLLNVSPMPVDQVELHVETAGATSLDPPRLQRLRPGELASVTFSLTRRPGLADGIFPMAAQVSARGKPLGVFDMELDTSRTETPGDRGMARLGHAQLRRAPSRAYQLFLLAVPVLVLAGWLVMRRRAKAPPRVTP